MVNRRFPLKTRASARVLGRQPFGVFLHLGEGAHGLMKMPALPRVAGSDEVVSPDLGAELTGYVVRHRDRNHQVESVAEDPVSDGFFRSLLPVQS